MIDFNPNMAANPASMLQNLQGGQAIPKDMQAFAKNLEALQPSGLQAVPGEGIAMPRSVSAPSFGEMIGDLVKDVDAKGKAAMKETNKLLLGETDNIHQSMIAMQESGVAFTMLVEVRNKLVQSYQELMRMPV